jgi:hypothetical protein
MRGFVATDIVGNGKSGILETKKEVSRYRSIMIEVLR